MQLLLRDAEGALASRKHARDADEDSRAHAPRHRGRGWMSSRLSRCARHASASLLSLLEHCNSGCMLFRNGRVQREMPEEKGAPLVKFQFSEGDTTFMREGVADTSRWDYHWATRCAQGSEE